MTSEERLKIAEEFIKARGWQGIHVGGLWVKFAPDGHAGWCVFHASGPETDPIACHEDQLEALYLARQKLAADREAKKSEREKRLEKAVEEFLSRFKVGSPIERAWIAVDELASALKES